MSKFQIIVADPPWSFDDKLRMSDVPRGAAANYPLLNLDEIKNLNVSELADPKGCVLALWVPSSMLLDGLDVMSSWGFQQRQIYVWVKTKKNPYDSFKKSFISSAKTFMAAENFNAIRLPGIREVWDAVSSTAGLGDILGFFMGHLFRQTHEICLIGINTTKVYKGLCNKSQRSVSFGENMKHSAKPEHLQNSLEIMFPEANKLEMFARRERNNWTTLGNEVGTKEDIRESIKKLVDSINENLAA